MGYPKPRMKRIVEIAVGAAEAHKAGARTYKATEHADGTGVSQTMDLATGGMCNRFARECYEVGLGLNAFCWPYGAGRAIWTLDKLDAAHAGIELCGTSGMMAGDIVGIHAGTYGHIAIYVGGGMVAENTISDTRGTPRCKGTKLTPYADLADRVTGIYRLAETAISVVRHSVAAGDITLTKRAQLIDGEAWAPVREMGVGLGYGVDASELQTHDRITLVAR